MSEAYSDEHITTTIDGVLKQMDLDKDGFISYAEFMQSERIENPNETS